MKKDDLKPILAQGHYVVEIDSTSKVENVKGTSEKTGKAYSFHKQSGWLHSEGKQYPEALSVMLSNDDKENPIKMDVGFYKIIKPIAVGGFESLAINKDISYEKIQ